MPPKTDWTSNSSDREAAAWLVALHEDPNDAALRARFEKWHAASPENARAWAATVRTYELIGHVSPTHAAHWMPYVAERASEGSHDGPVTFAEEQHRRRSPRTVAAMVGAAALVAAVVLTFAPGILLRLQAGHVTAVAELRVLRLEDGSVVRLGADSAIDIEFSAGRRLARLIQGEAFFEVAPDPDRPFRVIAGAVEVQAIGTAFEVGFASNGTQIAVREGLVGISNPQLASQAGERLGAGDWVRLSQDGEIARGSRPPGEIAAWLRGLLIVHDRPVGEALDDLRRHYRGVIIVAAPSLSKQSLTGVYNLSDPVGAVRAIAVAHGASVHRLTPWITVISPLKLY